MEQLFDTPRQEKALDVLPVSVIDIEPQGSREAQDHGKVSSRSGYSPFPREVADLCFEFFMRGRKHVFDPFAGWGERGFAANKYGVRYTGFDTSPEAITSARDKFSVENTHADSLVDDIPPFDGLVTCPPYWNLEIGAGRPLRAVRFSASWSVTGGRRAYITTWTSIHRPSSSPSGRQRWTRSSFPERKQARSRSCCPSAKGLGTPYGCMRT